MALSELQNAQVQTLIFSTKKAALRRFFTLRSEYFNDLHGQVGDSGAD